jgi:hypothetical protein
MYDTKGRELSELDEQWTNGQWVNSSRYSYTYDASGRELSELDEQWTNGQWVNSYRFTYTYDANGYTALFNSEQWTNSLWEPYNSSCSTLDSAGNDIEISGCKIILQYKQTLIAAVFEDIGTPTSFQLYQNYPNPFNPTTTIRYSLPNRSHAALAVFNTLGQQVAILQNGEQDAGFHEVQFDGSRLASGVYFYRLQAGEFVHTSKMLLTK